VGDAASPATQARVPLACQFPASGGVHGSYREQLRVSKATEHRKVFRLNDSAWDKKGSTGWAFGLPGLCAHHGQSGVFPYSLSRLASVSRMSPVRADRNWWDCSACCVLAKLEVKFSDRAWTSGGEGAPPGAFRRSRARVWFKLKRN